MLKKINIPQENGVMRQLWRAKLAEAARQPWLASYLLRHSARLYAKLRRFYQQLVTVICAGLRGRWLRRLLRTLPALLAGGGIALVVAFQPLSARAANITVNSTVDGPLASLAGNGTCDLREAIEAANSNTTVDVCPAGDAGLDIITLPAGTITLAAAGPGEDVNDTGDLDVLGTGGPLTINSGGGGTTIDGAGLDRVFHVIDSTLSLSSVTISGGSASADVGGGIFNDGSLTISGGSVISNAALIGGGIYTASTRVLILTNTSILSNTADINGGGISSCDGTITVTGSTILSNTAGLGGGISSCDSTVTVAGSTISGNTANYVGGGIYNTTGTVTVTGSTISGNNASYNGGGIYNYGTFTVTNSTISGNTAADTGGGAYNGATFTAISSTISGNTASYGGGIYILSCDTTTIQNSTISGNTAETGGGIYNGCYGLLTIANSTISGNTATGNGGGIYNYTADLIATNTTISGNTADNNNDDTGDGGGLFRQNGAITFINSIIALNVDGPSVAGTDHPDVSGEVTGNNHNLLSNTVGTAGTIGTGTDIVTTTVNLGPLANNGGNTQTHALLEGSPAIDAADNAVCAAAPVTGLDQRGQSRIGLEADGDQNGIVTCDIGAFEFLKLLTRFPFIFR